MYTILDEDWSDYDQHYKYNLYDAKDKEGKPGQLIGIIGNDNQTKSFTFLLSLTEQ